MSNKTLYEYIKNRRHTQIDGLKFSFSGSLSILELIKLTKTSFDPLFSNPDSGINFDLPEVRIDPGDIMLQIANNKTRAVAKGEMTTDEAEKFTDFLKHQRWHINQAESKKRDEERKKQRGY